MKYRMDPLLTKVLIVMLIVMNVIYVIRVGLDIIGTGMIMKEISPDGKYEVVVTKEKYQGTFATFSDDLSTFRLYEKESGKLVSYFENEINMFGEMYPEMSFKWYEDGCGISIVGDIWYHDSRAFYVLPYEQLSQR